MIPKYTIEIFDLVEADPEKRSLGFRVVSNNQNLDVVTDADYLVHSLTETLAHIGQVVPTEAIP